MTLDEAIFTVLSSNAGVAAICGDRSYPVQAPQTAAAPYVVWQRISSTPVNTHDGAAELDTVLVQFSCYGLTFTQAHDLRRAVRSALESVALGNGAVGIVANVRDGFEDAPTPPLFRSDVDIEFLAAP